MRRHPGNQSALRSANDSRRQLCLIKAPGREPFLWEQNNETHVICRDGPAGQRRALADECSSANTQTEMNQCAAAQYQAADKKLNDTWQQALQRAVGKQQTLLKQAQQAWIALRDADCAFLASGAEGGSMQPMLVSQCMTDKSVERESFLASLLQCEDGDQSCPLPPAN